MSAKSFLKCSCAQCGGHIEFPAEGLGLSIDCPHCAQPTELALVLPAPTSAFDSRNRKWIMAGAMVLMVGVAGVVGALILAQRLAKKARAADARSIVLAAPKATPPAPRAENFDGFSAAPARIESTAGSTLVYAVGTIKNETEKPRYGVTVELGLFDAAGTRLGSARDYKDTIEPRGRWSFRALLVQKSVTEARVSSVREQP